MNKRQKTCCTPSRKEDTNAGKNLEKNSIQEISSPHSSETVVPYDDMPILTMQKLTSEHFCYTLEAPSSGCVPADMDPMTYLNRDQYYFLNLHCEAVPGDAVATSIISVQFRDKDKPAEYCKHLWEIWASRHPDGNLRVLDVNNFDKDQTIEEHALNALKVQWMPGYQEPRVQIAVRSLSSEFCNQKGVKGIPLQLQVDTYLQEEGGGSSKFTLADRACCQLKTFVEKGAERQLRAEEKRHLNKLLKYATQCPMHVSTFVKTSRDALTDPIFFQVRLVKDMITQEPLVVEEEAPTTNSIIPESLIIFVRQDNERIFIPLVCNPGNLFGFAMALSRKFQMDPYDIRSLYKSQHQDNVIVHVDDALLSSLANQNFLMKIIAVNLKELDINRVIFDIILHDVDISSEN